MNDLELVTALCEIESGLTSLELDFVESLAEQVEAGRLLSDKQRDKAEAIYDRLNQ